MAYGHAERTLATIRLLEAETRDLLSRQEHLDQEQTEWLRDTETTPHHGSVRTARTVGAGRRA